MAETPPPPPAVRQSPVSKRTSQAAVWSLVLGVLSNCCLWLLGSVPAIILGIVALKGIDRNPNAVGGKGLAIAGIVTGGTGVVVGLVAVLFISGFSAGITAYNKGSNRAKCILQLSTVQKLAISHANMEGLKEGDPLPMTVFTEEGYLPAMPSCPGGGKYTALGKVPDSETAYLECDQTGHVLDPNR